MNKTIVLIPAYNAGKTVKNVIKKIDRDIVDDILVVDDGSQDNTRTVLDAIEDVKVLSHPQNEGYGIAAKTLYREALKDTGNFDFFITIHADGGHDPSEIRELIQPLEDGVADVVVGNRIEGILNKAPLVLKSRHLGAILYGEMPVHKFIANIILTKFQNWCYGTKFHSFHTGARACTRKALENIPLEELSDWYLYDTEFLFKANEAKLRIKEIPVSTHYPKDAGTKVPAIRYGTRIIFHALRCWFRRYF